MAIEYLDDTPASGKFEYLDEPGYLEKTVKNIIPDLKQTAVGIGSMIKEGAYEMPKRAMQTGVEMAGGVPYAETPSGRQDVGLVENAPKQAEEMVRPITHPIDYMQEHPVQQTLNILGAKELIGGMMPKKAPVGVPEMPMRPPEPPMAPPEAPLAAPGMPKVSPEPPPVAADVPPQPKAAPEPPPAAAARGASDLLQEVRDFVNEKASKTPGLIENVGKSLEQKARGMNLKEIGAAPGQIRVLRDRFGESAVNELSDLAKEKGITKGFFNFQTGEEIAKLKKTSGENIGAVRDVMARRGVVHDPNALIAAIRNELDPIYLKGSGSSQKGPYLKALEDIKNSKMDPASLADTITAKNKLANKSKLTQTIGATTDVLNKASRLNNELMLKNMSPQEAQFYQSNLKDFSAAKVFDKMYGFTYGRDMAGRSGPSSYLNIIKDVGGNKILEKVYSRLGETMQKTPGAYHNPTALSADILDAISESLDEVIAQMGTPQHGGMWEGGQVPDDVALWVNSKNK